jgi:tetratricopeptide (TPR) repeat protein
MHNRERKSSHLFAAIVFSVILSTVCAVFLVFMITNDISLPLSFVSKYPLSFSSKSQKPINELLNRGKIFDSFDIISNQPDSVQSSDTSLLTQGKAWYLIAWQRYESENWKSYAKNPNDWFLGKDVDKALMCLEQSAQSRDTWAQAATMIGVIYMEKGWYEKARNVFQNILKRDITQRDAFLYYGIVLSRLGQNENAVRHLEKWNDYLRDYDFVKNLFYLYLFDLKNYEKAAILGDIYLKIAPRGDVGIIKVKRELLDLVTRFPEYFYDTMVVIRDRPPEFKPRQR